MWAPSLTERHDLAAAIARALESDIDRGQLAPGEQLPTHRELAEHLKVSIGTVTRAYALAKDQGLVTGTTGRGTFVRQTSKAKPGTIDLSRNMVRRDPRDIGVRKLLGAYGDIAQMGLFLDEQQDSAGVAEHREAAAIWMRRPGFAPKADNIVICSGVQHAMHTILATIAKPGDLVVTEAVTYAGIKAIASLSGLALRGLPIDADGLDPQGFEDACRLGAKVLYTTPTLHNPTASIMSDRRRREISRIVETYGVTVLEDDVYGFLAPHAQPLAAYVPAHTYYLLSTSKSIAPGLRVAYAVCPPGLQQRIANTVRTTIWETSPLMTALVTKWIQDGTAERTIAYKQAEVQARHELAMRILTAATPPARVTPHWWISLPEPWRAEDLTNECRSRGITITPASTFAVNRDDFPIAVRVCLAAVATRQELEGALRTINEILMHGPTTQFATT